MKKYLVHGLCLGVLAIGLVSPMALSAATIQSTDIYAADGTSGQTLTTGRGVKTGHIQNLAVTGAKIATGTITSGNIQDATIATVDLANGAVTDAKISGTISASKIASTGLNADTLDGLHASAFAPAGLYQNKYGKVAVVAQSGGDYSDPAAAMSSSNLATWCGTPSASNPCQLKIMPGVYNIGAQTVQLSAFVDMEGSGEVITSITGTGLQVISMQGSEIRSLTIQRNSSPGDANSALVANAGNPRLQNVSVNAYGGSGMLLAAGVTMNNVAVFVDCGGQAGAGIDIQSAGGTSTLNNVSVRVVNAARR